MKSPVLKLMSLLTAGLFLFTSGCASSMTASMPPQTTIVEGEKRLGDTVGLRFDVSMEPQNQRLTLTQTPMCLEMVGREEVSRKQLHGVLPAIIEIGFFGLGIVDLVVAHAIIESTEKRAPMEDKPTGNQLPCGFTQPATHRQVILQYAGLEPLQYGRSDANGIIRPANPPPLGNFAYANVFVRTGSTKRFAGVAWLLPK